MKRILTLIITVAAIAWMHSCTYEVEDELYPPDKLPCDTCDSEPCDTENVSYSLDIVPIMKDNCYDCHSGSNPFGEKRLDSYQNLKETIERPSSDFYCSVKNESGCDRMPPNPRELLSSCQVELIETWESDGFPDN